MLTFVGAAIWLWPTVGRSAWEKLRTEGLALIERGERTVPAPAPVATAPRTTPAPAPAIQETATNEHAPTPTVALEPEAVPAPIAAQAPANAVETAAVAPQAHAIATAPAQHDAETAGLPHGPQVTETPQADEPVAAPEVVAADRSEADRLVTHARTVANSGRRDDAIALLQRAMSIDSRNHRAAAHLARLSLEGGQVEDALRWSATAVQLRRRRAAYRVLHGDALAAAGEPLRARAEWEAALVLDEGNALARARLGRH